MPNSNPSRNAKYLHNAPLYQTFSRKILPLDSTKTQNLKVYDIDQPGLDQLRLRHRRGDAQDRFIAEEHTAFRHGVDVAGEAKCRKLVEQCFVKPARAGEPVNFFGGEAKFLEKVEGLFEAGGDQEAAARRQFADKKF